MAPAHELRFGCFRLDMASERLWRATQELRLRPKSFAVLRCLVQRASQLVTKDEILEAVWLELAVDDGALTTCLREIRRVLGDDPRQPQIIETVHRRGYRIIAPVHRADVATKSARVDKATESGMLRRPPSAARRSAAMVGRDSAVQRLHAWFAQAQRGERRVVFVTGEPGIGKTTVVDQWLAEVAAGEAVWLAHGECIEQYGTAEPYLPVLAAQCVAEELLTLAQQHDFPLRLARGMNLRGWALTAQGHVAEGIAAMRESLAMHQAAGAVAARAQWLALLAEGYGITGRVDDGLEVLAEAFALTEASGERGWEAELYRLKGELLVRQPACRVTEAEACLQQALDLARRQEAKALELRAALSLARLWQGQGRRDEARMLLAEIYDWFTEGFDTADLREARALLETLEGRR